MWHYLKSAFLISVPVRRLGRLPVNLMALVAATAAGFLEPGIWLAAVGTEAVYIASLSCNKRFQALVDAKSRVEREPDRQAKLLSLMSALPDTLCKKSVALHDVASQTVRILLRQGAEPAQLGAARKSLDELEWLYLKLLVSRDYLQNDMGADARSVLRERISSLQQELAAGAGGELDSELRKSQKATLDLLMQREVNASTRAMLLRENESKLLRIETQVELMRDNATVNPNANPASFAIDLASDLAAPDLFGAYTGLVRDLEQARQD